jgi:crotonobetaine/carnitine-CoA ligase
MIADTVGGLLRQQARDLGEAAFLRFRAGDLTYREVTERSHDYAAGLRQLGVSESDSVAMLLPNCADLVLLWFAANLLGAIAAPLNTAFRGSLLAHVLNLSRARILIVDEPMLGAVAEVAGQLSSITHLVIKGDHDSGTVGSLTCTPLAALGRPGVGQELGHAVPAGSSDAAILLATSGTTGRSKLCELSHRYAIRQAELLAQNLRLTADDVLYCPFPLFHLDAAILTVLPALVLGGVAAIGERFSVSGFWPEVRSFGATVFDFMGATLTLLHRSPAAAGEHDNPVRLAWGVPVPAFAAEFESRFGLRLVELYGSTDAGIPVYEPLDEPRRPGSCGRPIPAYDVRLFDDQDNEVKAGAVGEIVIRPQEPDLMATGYYGLPEQTLAARRNLWFHTGDLARSDDDGYLYFAGRLSDAIRRRGENVSAFEVEEVLIGHADVLDAAAFAVPSDLTEDEIMVAVVARPGHTVSFESLAAYCQDRLARHMIPRYFELLAELPRTPTEKVQKRALMARGVTATTWDRERALGRRETPARLP